MSPVKVLEMYALCWNIEVCFKAAMQYLEFVTE